MARWMLRADHYLKCPNTKWRYNETDRDTGEQNEVIFDVPRYLEKERVVCHEGKGQRGDQVFFGDPTPDMDPLDEEAEAISALLRERWSHPINDLPMSGEYGGALIKQLEAMMTKIVAQPPAALPDPSIDEMRQQIAELTATVAALTEKPQGRRV